MNLISKFLCLLFYCFLLTEVFAQAESYIGTNGNIRNSSLAGSIDNISTFSPLGKNNYSAGVLDSLIVLFADSIKVRIAYNYNNDLSLNYFINETWGNGKWFISERHTNTYNSDRNLESVLWENFSTKTGEWFKDMKEIYKYDSLGNRVSSLHQFFNGQEFLNDFKYQYCYDARNNLVSSVSQQWKDSKWVNNYITINIFNSDNLKDTALVQHWLNNQWINYQMGIYEYDEKNNIVSIESKSWQENDWVNVGLGSFGYDDNDNCIIEDWMKVNNEFWESFFRIFYEYDENNNLIHLFGNEWENNGWIPANEVLKVRNPDGFLNGYVAKEIFLYYRKPTSVENGKNTTDRFNLFQNYPNPFNPSTTIEYEIPQSGNVKIKVYNSIGQLINVLVNEQKNKGKYSVIWNGKDRTGHNVSSGTYFYQIESGDFIKTKKMILLK